MTDRRALWLFILGTLGAGLLVGALSAPDMWYRGLAKPAFNPPDWVFGPVWTVLYVMIGVAGWRIWRRKDEGAAMAAWWAQLVLNFAWTPIFFRLHSLTLALVVILALLATILAFVALTWRRDHPSALLFLPYSAWVGFATLLTASIWRLNP